MDHLLAASVPYAETPYVQESGSLRLRAATSECHLRIESSLGVPGNILDLSGYARCLARFYGLYLPLEQQIAAVHGWQEWGLDPGERRHTPRLLHDLTALGVDLDQVEIAPAAALPDCSTFPRALGAMYVLEGSTLGGRFILQDLTARLGDQLADANAFFSGHGADSSRMWQSFRASVDRFALERPVEFAETISGAIATFEAIGGWMTRSRPELILTPPPALAPALPQQVPS